MCPALLFAPLAERVAARPYARRTARPAALPTPQTVFRAAPCAGATAVHLSVLDYRLLLILLRLVTGIRFILRRNTLVITLVD